MNYNQLLNKIHTYEKKYKVSIIGKTILGRNIYAVEKFLSEDFFTAIFIASVHAREYISTDLLCKFLDEGLFDDVDGFNISFILMANPDGVELSYFGLSSVNNEDIKNQLLKANNLSFDFSQWKANARGVDINNNFDANFGQNSHNIKPASQGYVGEFAESENETKAIINFTRTKNVFFSISYHSKGEEIYYNFFQKNDRLERDKLIAERFEKSTGYKIQNVENVSSGGYKDWCIQSLKIPALTIEIGGDELSHPISEENLLKIFEKHKTIANDLKFAYNIFRKYKIN